MVHRSTRRAQRPEGYSIPPETEYLVSDLEELVNERFSEHLDGVPFRVSVEGYRPDLATGTVPIGINRLNRSYLPAGPRELESIDFSFQFPLNPESSNPISTTVHWSDNLASRLALISSMPLLVVDNEKTGRTVKSSQLERVELATLLNTIGLPESIWGVDSGELFKDLHNARSFAMTRQADVVIDPYTNLGFEHDARIGEDIDGDRQIVQELRLNIDHIGADTEKIPGELYLPPRAQFRNALRFSRTDDDKAWKFMGAYSGKLGSGNLLYETVHLEPQLGVPAGKVIDKALAVLSQPSA